MKAIYTLGASLLMILSLGSCRNEIDIPQEMNTKTPTLNCLALSSSKTDLVVYLSRTSLGSPTAISGAHVSLSVNGTERTKAKEMSNNIPSKHLYSPYIMTTSISSGDVVEIKATTPQGEELIARQVVPPSPQLISATLGAYTPDSRSGHFPLKITLRDRDHETNYYRIVCKGVAICFSPEDTKRQNPVRIPLKYLSLNYRKDFILCDGNPKGIVDEEAELPEFSSNTFSNRYLTFGDHLFSGQETTITLELEPLESQLHDIYSDVDYKRYPNSVELSHAEVSIYLEGLTQDAHRYYRSLSAVSNEYYDPEDPFTTPIKLHSNVTNGAGIFAIGMRSEPIVLMLPRQ